MSDEHRQRGRHRADGRQPVPRSRSGVIGRRFERTGDEPITARSALGARLILSLFFIPVFAALTVVFALWAADSDGGDIPSSGSLWTLTWICAALLLFALVDLIVILRRRRRERGIA